MLRKLLCAAALVLLNNQALEAQLTVMAIVIVVALSLHLVRGGQQGERERARVVAAAVSSHA